MKALETLKKKLGREGKFLTAVQVLNEIEAVRNDATLEELPDNADFQLSSLRGKWERASRDLNDALQKSVAEIARKYIHALDARKEADAEILKRVLAGGLGEEP